MSEFLDIPALRDEDEAAFKKQAAEHFESHPETQSIVYGVAQYFADEAGDAVHTLAVTYPTRDPWWPHQCTYDAPPVDGSRCRGCSGSRREWQQFGSLDSNDAAVYAYSAFCAEYGGGEGESELHDPLLIARREPGGGVSLERVAHLARPWMDFPNAFVGREDAYEPAPPGKPEPEVRPWSEVEAGLIEKIYAAPDDDGPRRILVDHWLELGDPRGEFGALSFAGKPAGKPDRAWLGPLTAVVGYAGAEFRRGPFADRITAVFADAAALEKHAGHREWATVRSLRFAEGACGFSPAMRGLKKALGVTEAGLASLAAAPTPWKIETLGLMASEGSIASLATAWAKCTTLPALKTLVIEEVAPDQDLTPLITARPAAKLERIEIWLNIDEGRGDKSAARTLRKMVALRPGLEFRVGHHAMSGAKRGLVISASSSESKPTFALRGLGNHRELEAAAAAEQTVLGVDTPAPAGELAGPAPAPASLAAPAAPRELIAVPGWLVRKEVAAIKEATRGTSRTGWIVLGGTTVALLALLLMKLLL